MGTTSAAWWSPWSAGSPVPAVTSWAQQSMTWCQHHCAIPRAQGISLQNGQAPKISHSALWILVVPNFRRIHVSMLLGVARSYCPSAWYMMPRWNLGKGRDLDPDKVTFLYFPSREIPLKYPPGNQTWQWKIPSFSLMFPLKPPSRNSPWECLKTNLLKTTITPRKRTLTDDALHLGEGPDPYHPRIIHTVYSVHYW